jgi:hypothetical protein
MSKRCRLFCNKYNLKHKKPNCCVNNWKKIKITISKNILKKIMLVVTIALVFGLINFSSFTINNISGFQQNGKNVTSPLDRSNVSFENVGTDSNNFIPFTNGSYNIDMVYPADWYVEAYDPTFFTIFSPPEGRVDPFTANVVVSIDDLPNEQMSLAEYGNQIVANLKSSEMNFKLIDSDITDVTLDGSPAYKFIYTETIPAGDGYPALSVMSMEIGTIVNNKAYVLTFVAETDKFSDLLPTVQTMIGSFKILDNSFGDTKGSATADGPF